ncbi:MAG: AEC family transporter [Corallococcus sp.]|nr:AEC family transporter [Corallococcus sp.]
MNDFLFTANAVLPIVLITALGYILKKIKAVNDDFLAVANKLVYRVFLPVLLFYNIYNIKNFDAIDWKFVLFGVLGIIGIFAVGVLVCCLFTKENGKRGVLIQAMYRSNYAIIGIPLATAIFGEEGAAAASLMSAFAIPAFNILAVITLSIWNNEEKTKVNIGKILLGIVKNPLIIGVVAGLAVVGVRELFVTGNVTFRLTDIEFLFSAIKSLAAVATPFALIVLGGQFQFSAVKKQWKPIVFGTVLRTVVVPAVMLLIATAIFPYESGQYYAAFIALFGTPVAVMSSVLAREMNGDYELAGQLVVWTTLSSIVTVFAEILILRTLGIF